MAVRLKTPSRKELEHLLLTAVPQLIPTFLQKLRAHIPWLSALLALCIGSLLIISGFLPEDARMDTFLDDNILQASHFLDSCLGLLLVVSARGLLRRLDSAWLIGSAVLIVMSILSVRNGVRYDSLVLALFALALASSRAQFYRKTRLLADIGSRSWSIALALFACSFGVLFVVLNTHAKLLHDGFWKIGFTPELPQWMRLLAVLAGLLIAISLMRLISQKREKGRVENEEVQKAGLIADTANSAYSQLVRLGDKEVLFCREGGAFAMYGTQRNSLVVLGDPLGSQDGVTELIWSVTDSARERGLNPVFYQVRPENVPRYLDLGFSVFKLGEAAVVDLVKFDLADKPHTELRYLHRKGGRYGLTFELVPRGETTPELLAELRTISDAWLLEKKQREKRFSLGYFDAEYLAQFPLGLVRHEGRLVGFANLLMSGSEAAIDLMRYLPDTPNGLMDYFFVELMLYAKGVGATRFSLGMAPLSGLDQARGALWHRIGAFLYKYGEHFYNFHGLRKFKEKFLPEWEGRYLAVDSAVKLPLVLADINGLVSGGFRGTVLKK